MARRAGSAPDDVEERTAPSALPDDPAQRRATDLTGDLADPANSRPARASRRVVAAAGVLIAALTAAPLIGPRAPRRPVLDVAAIVVAALAVAVAVVDPWRHRPARDPRRFSHLAPIGLGCLLSALAVLFADGRMPGETGVWTAPAPLLDLAAAVSLLVGLGRLAARRVPDRAVELLADGLLPAVVIGTVAWPLISHSPLVVLTTVTAALSLAGALVAGRLADRYAAAGGGEMVLAAGTGMLLLGRGLGATAIVTQMDGPSAVPLAFLLGGLATVAVACATPALRNRRGAQRTETSAVALSHLGTVLVAVITVPPIVTIEVFRRTDGIVGSALAAAGPSLLVVGYLVWQVRERSRSQFDALHDPLTGLATRTLFDDRLNTALLTAQRKGGHLAVVALDLNRFKQINDTHGHGGGDKVLEEVADRIRGSVRAVDSVARFGGDEFMVLLPQLTTPDEWQPVVQRILEAVMQPMDLGGTEVLPGSSAGVAVFPEDGQTADTLMSNADQALYRSKVLGGRRSVRYDREFGAEVRYRTQLENGLHRALEREELSVHYQPVVDVATGRIVATEALLRWDHPQFGAVAPESFVSLAEHIGVISEIGEWVLDQACRQTIAWHAAGHDELRIAVNLSIRQFEAGAIDTVVARVLRRYGLDPHFLELELTESQAVDNPEECIASLNALRQMGVRCAIDDFGTGYSGLSSLLRLPVDTLKIDRTFVTHLAENPQDQSVVKAIIALAHSMEKIVIAEGVETAEQLAVLQDYECDHVQGFFFSRPVPDRELTELLSGQPQVDDADAGDAADTAEADAPAIAPAANIARLVDARRITAELVEVLRNQ
jgi:diguanylate cyclase (GGDEF)-like protein